MASVNGVSAASSSDSSITYEVSATGTDGVYTFTAEDESTGKTTEYTITLTESTSGGVSYSYTYESDTYYAATGALDETVKVYVDSSGDIEAVYVGSAQATEGSDDEGSSVWTCDGYSYYISSSASGGSYSYEVFFGISDTDYDGFVELLSYLSKGCTIVLYPYLTTAQLEWFAAALSDSSLSNVTVDMSYMPITEVAEKLFYECTKITSVILPSTVTSIANYAFYYCSKLTSVEIPDSVTSIGSFAFYGCTSLTSVTIGDSVTSIGSSAFRSCTSLTSVTIGDSVTTIDSYAFYGCTALTEVTIPDSVTSIGSFAFYGCTALTDVTIGDSVTSIGSYAFYQCTSLTEVTIPDSVTSISTYAFYGCTKLKTVTIGSAVTTISASSYSSSSSASGGAFGNCSDLATVYYNGTKDEWEEITINGLSYAKCNYYLKKASIICDDGTYTY